MAVTALQTPTDSLTCSVTGVDPGWEVAGLLPVPITGPQRGGSQGRAGHERL